LGLSAWCGTVAGLLEVVAIVVRKRSFDTNQLEDRAIAELIPNESLIPGVPGLPFRPAPLAALTEGGWSYIRREGEVREELYDLREDPREQNDVAVSAGSRLRLERMREVLLRLTLGPWTLDLFNP
jgi:hypothetical protein